MTRLRGVARERSSWHDHRMGLKEFREQARERMQESASQMKELRATMPALPARDVAAKPRKSRIKGSFAGVDLKHGELAWSEGRKKRREDVSGATARVESGADVQRRVTLTRMVAVGIFAFALKKQEGTGYLTIEHPGFQIMVPFPIKQERAAREFASSVNSAARES